MNRRSAPRPSRHVSTPALLLGLALGLGACPSGSGSDAAGRSKPLPGPSADPNTAPPSAQVTPAKRDGTPGSAPSSPATPNAGGGVGVKMGRILPSALPIDGILGHPPAEAEANLGTPLGKGMVRNSCVRYVPDRVWFKCKFVLQRYASKSDVLSAVGVEYEDGKATAVALDGLRVEGNFDLAQALTLAGLELPGSPTVETEGPTTIYSWFNSAARLLLDGRQYRVRVSVVDGDWARTKIEVILNDPLNESERARVMTGLAPGSGPATTPR